MSSAEGEQPEERLADALAAYDDRLAAGTAARREELDQDVDPALLPDWNRLTAFLSLVEKAWPRGDHDSDHSDPGHRTEPAPTEGASLREDAETTAPDAEVDRRFGRFQILKTLGQGGFGIVFLAWDPALRRQVALKVPQPESLLTPEARKRFQREAHAAAGLDHPNIVPVYETGSIGSVTYIAAAYCPGPTLAEWLARQPVRAPARDAAALTASLARAVEHAHERGVLHRDLKPSNVLLKRIADGDLPDDANAPLGLFEPRITDFSLAKIADGLGPETKSGVPFGSPPYMAPEQAEGKLKAIGPQTDVYGLGCILYELLTGSAPFRGEGQLDILRQVIADAPVPLRRVRKDTPVELEAIVLKCLEKNPARRVPSARELADDLDRFLAGEPTRARPPGRWERLAKRARRHRVALLVAAIVATCVITVLVGGRWYEARLSSARLLSEWKDVATRAREAGEGRRTEYARGIRQTDQLLRSNQAALALKVLQRLRPHAGEEDLREFAWYHLMRRCDMGSLTLREHRSEVYDVEFSPRGNLLASTGKDGMVLIWDTGNWRIDRRIPASGTEVNAAVFSPDGECLATVDDEGMLKLWETATGNKLVERRAHEGEATIARFTPDGKTIVTSGATDGIVRLWDRGSLAEVDRFSGRGAVLSPDGAILAMAGKSGAIELWNLSSRTLIKSLPVARAQQDAVFSHEGTMLATAHGGGHLVQLWDISSGRLLHEFRDHADGVLAVVFSLDDQSLISTSDDSTIRFWSIPKRMQDGLRLGHTGRVWNIALSSDGRQMVSAGRDGTIKVWNAEPNRDRIKLPIVNPSCFDFTKDGSTLISLDALDPWFIALWDFHSGSLVNRKQIILPQPTSARVWTALSADGQRLAFVNLDGSVTLWNTVTCRQERLDYPASGQANYAFFSADARYLYIQDGVERPSLWDLANQRLIPVPWDRIKSVHFTPASEVFVVLENGRLVWWDPSNGRTRSRFFSQIARLTSATFSPDCRLIGSVDPDTHRILLWSAETLELIREFAGHGVGCGRLAFSPDQKTLASSGADRTVKLWHVESGEELMTLEKYGSVVGEPRFSPDGRTLVTLGGFYGHEPEIFLWRTAQDAPEAAAPWQADSLASSN